MSASTDLHDWLQAHADGLDAGEHAAEVVPRLAAAGVFRRGVPAAWGGDGSALADAVDTIAWVAERSLTAAFVCWGQRAYIEYLLQSPNEDLRGDTLPALLAGHRAGATGLSNAMKYLSGIEQLGVLSHREGPGRWRLDGRLPWVTNAHPGGFTVAAAVAAQEGGAPMVVALPGQRAGVRRSEDLDLIALRGSHTAAIDLENVAIDARDVIHPQAHTFLPRVRPAFLGLQCALSIGLARASLARAAERLGPARAVLETPLADTRDALERTVGELQQGLADGRFVAQAPTLFRLRIALAEQAQQAVQLELLASGGRAYHRDQPLGFARRWREAAFIPIVTPSLSQLRGELAKQALAA